MAFVLTQDMLSITDASTEGCFRVKVGLPLGVTQAEFKAGDLSILVSPQYAELYNIRVVERLVISGRNTNTLYDYLLIKDFKNGIVKPYEPDSGDLTKVKSDISNLQSDYAKVENAPVNLIATKDKVGWRVGDFKFASFSAGLPANVPASALYIDNNEGLTSTDFFRELDDGRTYSYEFSYKLDARDFKNERLNNSADLMPLKSEGVFFTPNPFGMNTLNEDAIQVPKGTDWSRYLSRSMCMFGSQSQLSVSSGFPIGSNTNVPKGVFKDAPSSGMFTVHDDLAGNALVFIENKSFSYIKITSRGTIWQDKLSGGATGGIVCMDGSNTLELIMTDDDPATTQPLLAFSGKSCYRKPYLDSELGSLEEYFKVEFRDGSKDANTGFPQIGKDAELVQTDLTTREVRGSMWLNNNDTPVFI